MALDGNGPQMSLKEKRVAASFVLSVSNGPSAVDDQVLPPQSPPPPPLNFTIDRCLESERQAAALEKNTFIDPFHVSLVHPFGLFGILF